MAAAILQRLQATVHINRQSAILHTRSLIRCLTTDIEPVKETTESAEGLSPKGIKLESRPRDNRSKRTGVLALKLGMTQLYDKNGKRVPVTLLQLVNNQVVYVRTKEKEGYWALQVGAVNHPKPHRVTKPLRGHFKKAGVPTKRKIVEFRVSEDAVLPVGTRLCAAHFAVGQLVNVCAKTIGKGFQGVMKRHGMSGQPASHGVSLTHRKMGATGGGQEPGRIWPGKKMPGRMGGKMKPVQNLQVCRINHRYNVLYVKGAVPGHDNQYIKVIDTIARKPAILPPFPTYIDDANEPLPEEEFADFIHKPFEPSLEYPDKSLQRKKNT